MTKFMSPKFSVGGSSKAYRDNYDAVFGKRCKVTDNPCGTDTRPEGSPCTCEGCRHVFDEDDTADEEALLPGLADPAHERPLPKVEWTESFVRALVKDDD